MMEFVNGKNGNPWKSHILIDYGKQKMFETTNQIWMNHYMD